MNIPRNALFSLAMKKPVVIVDGKVYVGDPYPWDSSRTKTIREDAELSLNSKYGSSELKEKESLENLEFRVDGPESKELALQGWSLSPTFKGLDEAFKVDYLIIRENVHELFRVRKASTYPVIINGIIYDTSVRSRNLSDFEEAYTNLILGDVYRNSETAMREITDSVIKLEAILDQIAEIHTKNKQRRNYRYFIFSDNPVSNFDMDAVIDYLNGLFGPRFTFNNQGNIFDAILETNPDSRQELSSRLSSSRRFQLVEPNFEQLVYNDAIANEEYDGSGFYNVFSKSNPQLKFLPHVEEDVVSGYVIITGRCIISQDIFGVLHSRSIYNNIISSSGMYYGPLWRKLNDPEITEFGKVVAANVILNFYLNCLHHTSDGIRFTLPENLESYATKTDAMGGATVKYSELQKNVIDPRLLQANPDLARQLREPICIFTDSHNPKNVEEQNLSGQICLYHAKVMERLTGRSKEDIMDFLDCDRGVRRN